MPIPPVTEFEGQLPNEGEPASFPARAEALFDWLVGQGMPTFNAAVAAINIALNDNGTVLDTAGKAIALTTNANALVPTGGTGNAYTITPAVAVPAYEDGQTFLLRTNRLNTGPVTLKVGALAAVPVEKLNADGTTFADLVAGDFRPGEVHVVGYRAGRFELLSTPLNRFVRTDAPATISAPWTFQQAVTAAALSSTALTSLGQLTVQSQVPAILMIDTSGTAATHSATGILYNDSLFSIDTRNSASGLVQSDYIMTKGAAGAVEHRWNIAGAQWMRLATVEGISTVTLGPASGTNRVVPGNNACLLGAGGSLRWLEVYTQFPVNVSSDARLKSEIADLTEAERRAAAKIRTRTFTVNATGRKSVGYVAQEIIEAMASEGLDAFEYGLVSDGETYGVYYDAVNAFRLG